MLQAPMHITLQNQQIIQLIAACRESDPSSQRELYRFCYPQFIGICMRYAPDADTAGSIFNDAMLRIFKYLHQYQEQGQFKSWAKKIVTHCCLDFVRTNYKIQNSPVLDVTDQIVSLDPTALDKLSVKDIRKMIQSLPPATAIVFNLFIYEGFTHREISKALGIAEGSSKWHVNEGRRQLAHKITHLFKPRTLIK